MLRSQRGQALIETALLSMFLILIIAGIVDVGRAFGSYMAITNSAREGARTGARLPCNATTASVMKQAIIDSALREATGSTTTLVATDITVLPDPITACPITAGSMLEVQVRYNFSSIFGGILGLNPIPMSNRVRMVYFGNDYQ